MYNIIILHHCLFVPVPAALRLLRGGAATGAWGATRSRNLYNNCIGNSALASYMLGSKVATTYLYTTAGVAQ